MTGGANPFLALCRRAGGGLLGAFAIICAITTFSFFPYNADAQEKPSLNNHILGIGSCPPWNAQSPEVCYNSLEKVLAALGPRLDAGPDKTHMLINEGASASALKLKATELANRLGAEDRLIIYANIPLGRRVEEQSESANGYILELWSDNQPETVSDAIREGTWISAPAFAAMIHTIPAAEVILVLDTNDSYAVNMHLLDKHSVDHDGRPEALVSSAGAGQAAQLFRRPNDFAFRQASRPCSQGNGGDFEGCADGRGGRNTSGCNPDLRSS